MAMPIDILFDFAAVHVDKAAEVEVRIDFVFTDLGETWTVWVKRGPPPAVAGKLPAAGRITLDGDATVLQTYAAFSTSSTRTSPSSPRNPPVSCGKTSPTERP
jgi:alkyl sulfatase BDS1-like metallo-beta-lactamase superfamily hydrolase